MSTIKRGFESTRPPGSPLSGRVHMIYRRGKSTGIAYVEFDNPEHAELCMSKNKHLMGMRYIELFMASRQEMQRDMEAF